MVIVKRAGGGEACEEDCSHGIERSLALATALAPKIGYAAAAEIARDAAGSGKTIMETALEKGIASEEELLHLLDARRLTGE